jgi:hypothetical protein
VSDEPVLELHEAIELDRFITREPAIQELIAAAKGWDVLPDVTNSRRLRAALKELES